MYSSHNQKELNKWAYFKEDASKIFIHILKYLFEFLLQLLASPSYIKAFLQGFAKQARSSFKAIKRFVFYIMQDPLVFWLTGVILLWNYIDELLGPI